MMELDDLLLAALRQTAGDPSRVLRPPGGWPPSGYRAPPPATPEQLQESERRLGFRLPMAVRQVFMVVANGGFGPGYGLLGLLGGAADDLGHTAVADYLDRRSWNGQHGWYWPERLLPICHWGCGHYSCVTCEPDTGPRVIRYDPNLGEWMGFRDEGRGFAEWLRGWLHDEDLWRLPELNSDDAQSSRSLVQRRNQLRLFG